MGLGEYLQLLDWTACLIRTHKRGATPKELHPELSTPSNLRGVVGRKRAQLSQMVPLRSHRPGNIAAYRLRCGNINRKLKLTMTLRCERKGGWRHVCTSSPQLPESDRCQNSNSPEFATMDQPANSGIPLVLGNVLTVSRVY